MRVVITCGGTGGHIVPALAIADIIRENEPHAEILFVGGKNGMEKELVTRAGYEIRLLDVQGLSRRISFSNFRAVARAIRASGEARRILKSFRPDLVIGTGGYACYPTLRAAISLRIPTAVHESNAVPGLAVKLLAPRLDRVWLNFEKAREALPKRSRTLVVGNPLPRGYRTPTPVAMPEGCEKMLLSFGGSLGAERINRAMLSLMKSEAAHPQIYHVHATGKREYDKMHADFCAAGLDACKNLCLLPFITEMPRYMAAADVVISRAGAMSVSELAALGCAAILVPSPNVTGNHQYKNAAALSEMGAAVLIREEELEKELAPAILTLFSDGERRRQMSRNIREFYHAHANKRIWRDILLLKKRK
ncbi:MAG: undecaprenyldiphospho-muramoylpentapeptide beta-N-acetylglucosaminyltransferase [Ruminococcaceae bacterium]|nr:undecaprenyldiphospho-muramoylpentapeptide beta-N-acetylglucosaminyltransferase [Oscillospiraceae bacterium]